MNPFKQKLIYVLLPVGLLCGCSKSDDTQIQGSGVFQSAVDNGIIEGELFLPEGNGPFPVMIIVPGSGLGTREESEPFADLFNEVGHAVYTYDKRGTGGSSGTYPPEDADGTEFLTARADDILAIIKTLKQHSDIDVNKIGLSGSSQGTWVSAIVFDQSDDISYIMLSSGGAVPTGYEFFFDNYLLDNPTSTVEEGHEELANFTGDLGFDSRPFFEQMEIPVLFVLGGMDRSHPTLWELDYVESLNKSNFEVHFYPNSDHELEDVDTGEFHPDMIPRLLEWLAANT